MTRTRIVHLLDDLAFGGVTRGLAVFDDPKLTAICHCHVREVDPSRRIAPRLDADVIVVNFPPRWNGLPFLASLRLRNPGARIIHVEHSYTRSWAALHVAHAVRFGRLLRVWFAACDDVVAVSHGQARWLEEISGTRKAIEVIYPWGGTHGLWSVPQPQAHSGPLRIAAYGRFAEQKGFDTLIEAMRLLEGEDIVLDLGGFGPDDAMLREAAKGLGNVRFIGKVTDLPAFLAPCDLVIIPSRWEAFGQVAAEAKMAARPMLVADVDGLPEQTLDPRWIADCSTPQAIARALRAIDRDALPAVGRAQRADMVAAGDVRVTGWVALLQSPAFTSRPCPRRIAPIPAVA